MKSLSNLDIGEKFIVKEIEKESKVRRKLLDMGITLGTEIKVTGKAPFGDPIEIKLRGYKLMLRKDEAKSVIGE